MSKNIAEVIIDELSFSDWANALGYLNKNQRHMLFNCAQLIAQHEVTDEWLIGSLGPLNFEDKNIFMDYVNLHYMLNKVEDNG